MFVKLQHAAWVKIIWETYLNPDCWAQAWVSDSEGLGWDPRICISNRLPGKGASLRESQLQQKGQTDTREAGLG